MKRLRWLDMFDGVDENGNHLTTSIQSDATVQTAIWVARAYVMADSGECTMNDAELLAVFKSQVVSPEEYDDEQ